MEPHHGLAEWLVHAAKLSDVQFESATVLCHDNEIGTVDDLIALLEDNSLDTVGFSKPTLAKFKIALGDSGRAGRGGGGDESPAVEQPAVACPRGKSGNHIFLSYRRLDRPTALNVKHALERTGYTVFMDTDRDSGLGAGDFQAQLEYVLKNTPVVVALLMPTVNPATGLVEYLRIKNPGDFVRLELRAALSFEKLLIPVHTEKFEIGPMVHGECLPPDISDLGKMNFVGLSESYFDASIDRVHRFIEERAVVRSSPPQPRRHPAAAAPVSVDIPDCSTLSHIGRDRPATSPSS